MKEEIDRIKVKCREMDRQRERMEKYMCKRRGWKDKEIGGKTKRWKGKRDREIDCQDREKG